MTYQFSFKDCLDGVTNTIEESFRGSNLQGFIKKAVGSNREELNKFLEYFGEAEFTVAEKDSRKLIARGVYRCNAFSGRDSLEFRMVNN